ncbi:DUF134 domain-containing protein [Candidatus Thorarchaeota archaeon]|nr:MAG: DUF134 domain-containing protein [Candidatus Thorarchaeota archaeon]
MSVTFCPSRSFLLPPSLQDDMPRSKRWRRVSREPSVSVYKPAGIPAKDLDEILLTVDEFEAIRLADFVGMTQREASEAMNISQPTFNRTLASARNKIAQGLVEGCVIRIEGGRYVLADGSGALECRECGHIMEGVTTGQTACPKCGSTRLRWVRWKEDNGD